MLRVDRRELPNCAVELPHNMRLRELRCWCLERTEPFLRGKAARGLDESLKATLATTGEQQSTRRCLRFRQQISAIVVVTPRITTRQRQRKIGGTGGGNIVRIQQLSGVVVRHAAAASSPASPRKRDDARCVVRYRHSLRD
jgi:hypothetical protein